MDKSRLVEIFRSLDDQEVKELRKFVRSPFFNQRAHVVQLFVFLEKSRKTGHQLPVREKAFAFIWPNQAYDDHKLRLSMSLLLKVFEKYLVWQAFSDDEAALKLKLSEVYRQRGLTRQFTKTITEVAAIQDASEQRDAVYYQNRYLFFLEQYQLSSKQNRMKDLPLAEVQVNLDIAYLASKLKQSCLMLSHQAIYKQAYDFGMLDEILVYVEENDYLKYPAISVYYYAYKALIERKQEAYFSTFKKLIFAHQNLFPLNEIRDLFLLATNYCIQQLNQGHSHFAKEGLDIYKEGLKNDILLLNGILSNFTYSNIVAKAIVSKDYTWAANFVHQYKDKLAPQHRESNFSFNLAWLKYEQKDYEEALDLLHKTNFSDLLLNISAKVITLKIYYEFEAFELLYSHLDAMRGFLNRKKILAYHKESYANTVKYTKKILDLPPADRHAKRELRKEVEAVTAIAEKKWLLAQLD